jgi:hypothetical protein
MPDKFPAEPELSHSSRAYSLATFLVKHLSRLTFHTREFDPVRARADSWQLPCVAVAPALLAWLKLSDALTTAVRTEARAASWPSQVEFKFGDQPPATSVLEAVAAMGEHLRFALYAAREGEPTNAEGWSGQAAAQSIESVMREMQARQKVVNPAHPLKWPRCTCDDIEAPPYPPDGFYGSQMSDPRRAAELVRYVLDQFEVAAQWREFVREEVGQGLEGKATNWDVLVPDPEFPAQWLYADGEGPGGIWDTPDGIPGNPTVENYAGVLKLVSDAVNKLHYRELPVTPSVVGVQIGQHNSPEQECEGPFASCQDQVLCEKAEIEETSLAWGPAATHLPTMSPPSTKLIGSEEALYLSMSPATGSNACSDPNWCTECTDLIPGVNSLGFSANKGTFSKDLRAYKGTGKLYAIATKFNLEVGSNTPPCTTDEKYYAVDTFGGEQQWTHTIGGGIQPKMTLQCSDWGSGAIVAGGPCIRACFRGWAITESPPPGSRPVISSALWSMATTPSGGR